MSSSADNLALEIGDQTITFHSLAEFEFAMSGRTDVPSRKIAELVALTREELKKEAKAIKAVEQMFVDVLAKSIDEPGTIAELLSQIDVHVFSQDHHWRDLMRSLNEKPEDYDDLRRIALVKYMQYLRSRQDVIKQTYAVKKREDRAQTNSTSQTDNKSPDIRDTVIFDTVVAEQDKDQTKDFTRLPKGESVHLKLHPKEIVPLRLSKHAFHIVHDDTLRLIDDQNEPHVLKRGKNVVGRDSVCNIVLDSVYRDVSRVHLIIEVSSEDTVRITDLSSHGSYVPRRFVDFDQHQ
ncbi:MAG: FHA domain-containing protein [Pseudomonadota bacterium]